MIQSVRFHNFKAIRDAEIALGGLTVLVGPNASGKTSVLQGLKYLCDLARLPARQVFEGRRSPKVLVTSDATGELSIGVEGQWGDTLSRVLLRVEAPVAWSFSLDGSWRGQSFHYTMPPGRGDWFADEKRKLIVRPESLAFSQDLSSALLLRLDPAQLAEPTSAESPRTQIQEDGLGLAGVVAEMAVTSPRALRELQEAVRAVVPVVDEIRLVRVAVPASELEKVDIDKKTYYRQVTRSVSGFELVADMVGAPGVPAHALSGGTLITIGLLTVLTGPRRPNLVLLDDVETSLHPKALGDLVAQLRSILDRFPDMQIVATSHSPYMLDHLKPEEVRVSTLNAEGHALFGRLSDHPEFDKWKDVMKPGEFWSTFGEKWVDKEARQPNA